MSRKKPIFKSHDQAKILKSVENMVYHILDISGISSLKTGWC